jgi:hypothetical protein
MSILKMTILPDSNGTCRRRMEAEKLVVHVAGDAFCQTAYIFYAEPHTMIR